MTATGNKVHLLELLDAIIHVADCRANISAKTVVFLQQEIQDRGLRSGIVEKGEAGTRLKTGTRGKERKAVDSGEW